MLFKEKLKNKRLYLDGGCGTLLQQKGLAPGELPELWSLSHRQDMIEIHKSYFDAGTNIVCSNTFGANTLKFGEKTEEIIAAAIENAKEAAKLSENKGEKYVALDIGPLGKLLKPLGDLDFERAVEIFADTVKFGAAHGADLIFIETMSDSYETKAAVLAAKENCDLPIFASNAYGEDGKLLTGASPSAMVALLEGLSVDAIGVNCSLGPEQLMGPIKELLEHSSTPIFAKPNAGLPKSDGERTFYDLDADGFAEQMTEIAKLGVNILGGCCGTTPEYIEKTVAAANNIPPAPISDKNITCISSYGKYAELSEMPLIIGERINPTGKKRFKQALIDGDIDYILGEAVSQQDMGAHILDVNVGLPDIDEVSVLEHTVFELQAVTDLPLQIDTSHAEAMERALRIYNGKAMINSVNGKKESMEAIFPLVKKYGGTVVALTLDESGIPETFEGRIAVAEKILDTAKQYGIPKKDIVFDPMCMSVSVDTSAAATTLKAVNYIRNVLKCHTVLGVSNVSFGLPSRGTVNGAFLTLALENGLSAAIVNPKSTDILKAYKTFLLLKGFDKNCTEYISFAENLEESSVIKTASDSAVGGDGSLSDAVVRGLKERAAESCKALLEKEDAMTVINDHIIPGLNIVGEKFEQKKLYLPQLLMSADAAKAAFEVIKTVMANSEVKKEKKAKFVIATVKGDIHDIGKNIVKTLLENYDFDVIDLGKDVDPEKIVDTVKKTGAPLCGLSALMTTTVPAMEDTIIKLRAAVPECKIVVGGAVMNPEYAERIGADKYAKDAMETVRFAEQINAQLKD